ncbi:unnamed protein product [Diatraea saccharalis]|uniref:CHK kinase-like domain-containing protein n=1 Tax=Diatraea saccharalis TaxID=40085 RepID=A0A9N9WC42_9NEOP|nr:unnamed protein product [Diatraea saccharalis]
MADGNGTTERRRKVEEVFNEKQLYHVVNKYVDDESWRLIGSEVAPASETMAGFLSDHLKITLHVEVKGRQEDIRLFVKRVPSDNLPKAEFVEMKNFFKKEMAMFQMFEEMHTTEDRPCFVKALYYNDKMIVMRDLSVDGYSIRPKLVCMDLPHLRLAAASIAKFHAAFVNYETTKAIQKSYNFLDQYGDVVTETVYLDSPWLRTGAKLIANVLKIFSDKHKNLVQDLEDKISDLFIKACDSFTEYKDTVNVANHKDLWNNNIMFCYENGAPVNAILVDYQCICYGPPAYDVMQFMYFNTRREFRKQHDDDILHHYYTVFMESLDEAAERKVKTLNYDKRQFLEWCERARMFGMVAALSLFPFVLMDPLVSQKTYDDPATYEKYMSEDRTEPVVAHANESPIFKVRLVELAEEFFERYIVDQP